MQELSHDERADRVATLGEGTRQLARALARPPQRRHGVPAGIGVDQSLQLGDDLRSVLAQLLPTTAHPADPFRRRPGALQFAEARRDGRT